MSESNNSGKLKAAFESVVGSGFPEWPVTNQNAEHMGANLLPCNAAARLQALTRRADMSPLAQFDQELEKIIRELTLRILIPQLSEFDFVWEAANRICDRYEILKAA